MEKRNISIYWLIDKMITKKHTDSELNDIFNKAKAMHKDEIINSYCKAGLDIAHNDSIKESGLAQEYYNERFGGDNE